MKRLLMTIGMLLAVAGSLEAGQYCYSYGYPAYNYSYATSSYYAPSYSYYSPSYSCGSSYGHYSYPSYSYSYPSYAYSYPSYSYGYSSYSYPSCGYSSYYSPTYYTTPSYYYSTPSCYSAPTYYHSTPSYYSSPTYHYSTPSYYYAPSSCHLGSTTDTVSPTVAAAVVPEAPEKAPMVLSHEALAERQEAILASFRGPGVSNVDESAIFDDIEGDENFAYVVVQVPEDAKLFLGGHATATTGTVRKFKIPVGESQDGHEYVIRTEVIRDGETYVAEATETLVPGETVSVKVKDIELTTL